MSLRMGYGPIAACASLFLLTQLAPAQNKIAVVNMQAAVLGTAEINKANNEMQAKFKPRADQMQQLQQQIAALAQQLQTNAGKLTPQAEADLQAEGSRKQRELQRMQDDYNADAEAYRNEVLQGSTKKMSEVVKKLAEEKGLDMVVDTGTVIFFKPTLDITADAIKAYDQTYPVAAAPAAPATKK